MKTLAFVSCLLLICLPVLGGTLPPPGWPSSVVVTLPTASVIPPLTATWSGFQYQNVVNGSYALSLDPENHTILLYADTTRDWQMTWHETSWPLPSDSGLVLDDFGWGDSGFGLSAGSGPAASGIPEPASLALLLPILAIRRRRTAR